MRPVARQGKVRIRPREELLHRESGQIEVVPRPHLYGEQLSQGRAREEPAGELAVDGANGPAEERRKPILAEPFVIRFNLHRTPRAPLTLPVILGARFPAGVVKLDDAALDAGRLTVCDAPLVAISPLPARN